MLAPKSKKRDFQKISTTENEGTIHRNRNNKSCSLLKSLLKDEKSAGLGDIHAELIKNAPLEIYFMIIIKSLTKWLKQGKISLNLH